jgi:hypothetical protein
VRPASQQQQDLKRQSPYRRGYTQSRAERLRETRVRTSHRPSRTHSVTPDDLDPYPFFQSALSHKSQAYPTYSPTVSLSWTHSILFGLNSSLPSSTGRLSARNPSCFVRPSFVFCSSPPSRIVSPLHSAHRLSNALVFHKSACFVF